MDNGNTKGHPTTQYFMIKNMDSCIGLVPGASLSLLRLQMQIAFASKKTQSKWKRTWSDFAFTQQNNGIRNSLPDPISVPDL